MRNVQTTLLYQWFDKVWNNGDEKAIDELMNPYRPFIQQVAGRFKLGKSATQFLKKEYSIFTN